MDPTAWVGSLISGYRGTAVVGTAASLGLPGLIAKGHQTVDSLAASTGTTPHRLTHLLRALVALGLQIGSEDGRFLLSAFGDTLLDDRPGSLGQSAIYAASCSAPAFVGLTASLFDDTSAFEHQFGADFYSVVTGNPEVLTAFTAMLDIPGYTAAVSAALDLSHRSVVVDVGGGDGALLVELLQEPATPWCLVRDTGNGGPRSNPFWRSCLGGKIRGTDRRLPGRCPARR
ncbi:methyltransferase family protein [Kribbella monticola]|uniref:methyltransferase family protein n=1 Tax=Kribbella monticola TaxID=2185285 RepID=UPI001E34AE2E|nr:hypothetical protein [Kribbella monticola]